MRNQDGLTHKEWIFCEEYLKDGNMERAYKVAFPNDKGRNGWRTAKRKEVICYISKRLHEKQATLSRLKDKSNNSLLKKLEDPDPEVSLEASKIVAKLDELEIKYKELSVKEKELEVAKESPNQPMILNVEYNVVKKD